MANAIKAFNSIINDISLNQDRYLARFNFSACELWLCTEICYLLNFKDTYGISTKDNEFAYNEDCKRDISFYNDAESTTLSDHIEVKVVYPNGKYRVTSKNNWLDNLLNKLNHSKMDAPLQVNHHGWVFGVWTSDERYTKHFSTPEDFFKNDYDLIHARLVEKHSSPSSFKYVDIMDDTLMWRGIEKRIVVKGFQFTRSAK
ncbi:hypothetical protein OKT24_20045 [Aeromonas veronii]|nr:hypothetical protein [Aeromonas veronii]